MKAGDPHLSDAERELQMAAQQAAASTSTNPWKPVKTALSAHAKGSAHSIGIQDSTVIDRAVGSPGAQKAYDAHSFVVLQPKPNRKSAPLHQVVDRVRRAITAEPYATTVVVIPHENDYAPSHLLSCDPQVGPRLAGLYPHAKHELDLRKNDGAQPPIAAGPWTISGSHLRRTATGGVVAIVDPAIELRQVHAGDVFIITSSGGATTGLGVVDHVRRASTGHQAIVFGQVAEGPSGFAAE